MPNFDQEAADAIKYDGLPPLLQKKQVKSAIFTNVQTLYTKAKGLKAETLTVNNQHGVVVVENGRIICSGQPEHCPEFLHSPNYTERIDLQGGSIAPGLLTYGAQIGLVEMETEESANDGVAYAPIKQTVPSILGKGPLSHAIDGLQFLGRDTLYVCLTKWRKLLINYGQAVVPLRDNDRDHCPYSFWVSRRA